MTSVLIFTKVPGLVPVKTRLQAGETKPLDEDSTNLLATAFLADTLETVSAINTEVFLALEPAVDKNKLKDIIQSSLENYPSTIVDRCTLIDQAGETFGEKLELAVKKAYEAQKGGVLILGSDCPLLSTREIRSSLQLIADGNCILGPTPNGGIYMIGLTAKALESGFSIKDLFTQPDHMELEAFSNSFRKANLPFLLLRCLPDVDIMEDLIGLQAILNSSSLSLHSNLSLAAPQTRKVLGKLNLNFQRSADNSRAFRSL